MCMLRTGVLTCSRNPSSSLPLPTVAPAPEKYTHKLAQWVTDCKSPDSGYVHTRQYLHFLKYYSCRTQILAGSCSMQHWVAH
jgi:hypothetical protein